MENFIENQPTNSLAYLEAKEDWEKEIAKTRELYDWNTLELLNENMFDKVVEDLSFKEVLPAERTVCAETAGRLAVGLMNFGGMRAFLAEEKSRFEIIMLRDKLSGHNPDMTPFLHMLCLHLAREDNTNTSGGSDRAFSKVITDAAVNAAKAGQPEIHDALMNPFHLENGMEILKFNEQTGGAEKMTIETLIVNGEGIISFGRGENDYEDIMTFNQKLSMGDYLTKDGESIFGGSGYIKEKLHLDKLLPGSVITIDTSHPPLWEPGTEEVTMVQSNQSELEKKYGRAWPIFLDRAPRNKKMLTVSLKSAAGEIFNDVDFMTLKIVK